MKKKTKFHNYYLQKNNMNNKNKYKIFLPSWYKEAVNPNKNSKNQKLVRQIYHLFNIELVEKLEFIIMFTINKRK